MSGDIKTFLIACGAALVVLIVTNRFGDKIPLIGDLLSPAPPTEPPAGG